MRLLRSMLFTPGNRPRMVEKAGTVGADAVILDLEDSVPIEEKEATRPAVRKAIDSIHNETGTTVFVRVNPLGSKTAYSRDLAAGDLEAVVSANLAGVILPKTESADEVRTVDMIISGMEQACGLAHGQVELIPMVETARGILAAYEIAQAAPGRVRRLSTGAADLTVDLGIAWTRDEQELFYARSHLVMVSRAAGLEPPIDAVWADIQDVEGLINSTRLGKQLGFGGKTCIHPQQVPIINEIYSPSPEEVARARAIVAAFTEAEREGKASIKYEGRMLDYPELERARKTVARAEEIERRSAKQH